MYNGDKESMADVCAPSEAGETSVNDQETVAELEGQKMGGS